jgi:hypothetical protein
METKAPGEAPTPRATDDAGKVNASTRQPLKPSERAGPASRYTAP